MLRKKYGIARTGHCRVGGPLLSATNDPHELNLDAGQRELDRRAAEGEDVSHLWVNPATYAVEPLPADLERQRIEADLARGANKGAKLAARHDAIALDLQTNGFNLRQQLQREEADRIAGMNWPAIPELPELSDADRNLAADWSGLGADDLELKS